MKLSILVFILLELKFDPRVKMDFLQATRYIFRLFKVFAIIPFDISAGPPGQLHIQKNRKCFILGNALLTMFSCFLIYKLVALWMSLDKLEDYVHLFAIGVFVVEVYLGILTSLLYHHKYIQFFHESIEISDLHPNTRKYLKTIFHFFIFKLFYIIISLIFELWIHFFAKDFTIITITEDFFYIFLVIYHFAFISQFHLILISTICIFKALNENLLNFQIHFNSFHKLFDIFENIVTLGEWNLLNLIFLCFFGLVSNSFKCMVSVIYIDSRLPSNIWFLVNMLNYLVQHLIVMCLLIQQLQREVR